MASHSDLQHAISLHPHPFSLHSHSSSHLQRSGSSASPIPLTPSHRVASSTSYEVSIHVADENDAVARHASIPASTAREVTVDGPASTYTREDDPYALSVGLKTPSQIRAIVPMGAHRSGACTFALPRRSIRRADKIRGFYEKQNENIERLLKPVDEHRRKAREEHGENELRFKIAVQGSFVANLMLAVLQVYAAASSGSLSLFTTMADAIFDPMSNLTLILSNRAVNRVDARRYPSGKARIETAGNIVFCSLMCSVSFILIVTSIRGLAEGSKSETTGFKLPSVIAVAIALATKLGLFLYCWALRNTYSQIRIIWEDHRNDLIVNAFGILTSVGGSKLRWWIDPAGAITLAVLIACLWLRTAYTEFLLLIGVTADPELHQLITYMSMTHSPMISQIDTVRAYYSGPRMIVEVDVVMDPDDTLRASHDVAEELQMKLESLPDVERAYVHVDYETTHRPEHFLKKEL
ncbi:MAG: hypothetical protein M1832_005021 [Thelocarpon impressellum]|nr:MAG: hypothetical protein M1832_005021 [Thelocarpon impressellum]